jgi:HUS1 checkpoint protein
VTYFRLDFGNLTISQESIFEETDYTLESNTGVINLEVPLPSLHRALRSAAAAKWVQLRLTQKAKVPLLALTIRAKSRTKQGNPLGTTSTVNDAQGEAFGTAPPGDGEEGAGLLYTARERETFITQEIPVKVLHESAVEGLHEPRCRDPDVHIVLPDLFQLKSISERFTKLAADSTPKAAAAAATMTSSNNFMDQTLDSGSGTGIGTRAPGVSPKLELSANMHGSLRLSIATDALKISSVWSDLVNPALDPSQLSQTQIEQLPSERMRALGGDDEAGWAKVRIDGRDWARVLSVGRMNPKVVACKLFLIVNDSRSGGMQREGRVNCGPDAGFIHETALVLYVYLPGSLNGDESCLTVSLPIRLSTYSPAHLSFKRYIN